MPDVYLKLSKSHSDAIQAFRDEDASTVAKMVKLSRKHGFHTTSVAIESFWVHKSVGGFYPRKGQTVDTKLFKRLKSSEEVWFPRRAVRSNKDLVAAFDDNRLVANHRISVYLGLKYLQNGIAFRVGVKRRGNHIYIHYDTRQGVARYGNPVSLKTWESVESS